MAAPTVPLPNPNDGLVAPGLKGPEKGEGEWAETAPTPVPGKDELTYQTRPIPPPPVVTPNVPGPTAPPAVRMVEDVPTPLPAAPTKPDPAVETRMVEDLPPAK